MKKNRFEQQLRQQQKLRRVRTVKKLSGSFGTGYVF
jgi:hypothetical protein